MAEKVLEARQKALRRTDYDSLSEEEEDRSEVTNFTASSSTSSSSMRQRGRPVPSHHPLIPSFDPYAPPSSSSNGVTHTKANPPRNSLFDESAFELPPISDDDNFNTKATSSLIPGAAGFLEMEQEPPRETMPPPLNVSDNDQIKTSSGLLLTHRRSPTNKKKPRPSEFDDVPAQNHLRGGAYRNAQKDYFEVENGYWNSKPSHQRNSMGMVQARRFMSYVKIWVVISAVLLIAATGVLLHSFGHPKQTVEDLTVVSQVNSDPQLRSVASMTSANNADLQLPAQIILVPMENISELADNQKQQQQQQQQHRRQQENPSMQLGFHNAHEKKHSNNQQHGVRRVLLELEDEFETWAAQHGKTYHSKDEKEHRFNIWTQNNHRTNEKNRRHGKCKLTKQPVFGSNHLQDMSPEEFKAKYLTGYKGPKTDELEKPRKEMSPNVRKLSSHSGQVLNPRVQKVNYHESVKQRLLQQQQPIMTSSSPYCAWYDIPCFLRWLWQSAGVQFGSLIGTMEPGYNADTYPYAVDWRDSGAVSDVRTQGECGACWAITAVETVESAHFLSTGTLYTLSAAEIITCDTSCEMCNGGWPQNAFEWVMEYGGLPTQNSFPYDGSSLSGMTAGIEGTSNTWTEDLVDEYRQQVCPAGDGSNDSSDSQEDYNDDGKENGNYGDYSDQGRYGNIKGYGYATDRCICYSDGSGCSCTSQNEDVAVGNLATYGPAVVCLEASLWQDYSGGIITSELGCSSSFMDMNHCVQAVGYRFTDGTDQEDDEEDGDNNSNSGSNDNSGSQDSTNRQGYWIIRNQWGSSWGMNGYAYVAMGDNTCGVLNDMTQAYL